MEITFILIVAAVIFLAGFGFFTYFISRKLKELAENPKDDQGLLMLNQNIQGIKTQLDQNMQNMQGQLDKNQTRIDKTTQALGERLDNAARVIKDVEKELGGVREIGHQMKDFQNLLKSPKIRGNIGEQILKDLLEQYFPQGQFVLQYPFKSSGERVDAIIKTDQGIIPIDAKFPMENFQKSFKSETEEEKQRCLHDFIKDVKKHINDISKKYILPQEGTVDFAVMYVPSETVYYEIIRGEEDLQQFARDKNILVVSPNSFYYFLKVIMVGMQGKRIEEASKKILETLNAIHKDSEKFGDALSILTSHVNHAKTTIDKVNNDYAKLANKIDNVKLLK